MMEMNLDMDDDSIYYDDVGDNGISDNEMNYGDEDSEDIIISGNEWDYSNSIGDDCFGLDDYYCDDNGDFFYLHPDSNSCLATDVESTLSVPVNTETIFVVDPNGITYKKALGKKLETKTKITGTELKSNDLTVSFKSDFFDFLIKAEEKTSNSDCRNPEKEVGYDSCKKPILLGRTEMAAYKPALTLPIFRTLLDNSESKNELNNCVPVDVSNLTAKGNLESCGVSSNKAENMDPDEDPVNKTEISATKPIKIERNDLIIKTLIESFEGMIDEKYLSLLSNNEVCKQEKLSPSDFNYIMIKNSFDTSMRSGTKLQCRNYVVQGIEKIICPYLWVQFKIMEGKKRKLAGYVSTEEVYHGTKKANIPLICKNNFDWRKCGTHVGTKFGKGISMAKYATYATFYPKVSEIPRAMVVTKILYVRKEVGNLFMTVPSEGYDTTINRKGEVIVKYDDAEYCPLYVIYYC